MPLQRTNLPRSECLGETTGQSVYCYTKDVPADMVSSYQATLTSRPSIDEARGEVPLPITPPSHP